MFVYLDSSDNVVAASSTDLTVEEVQTRLPNSDVTTRIAKARFDSDNNDEDEDQG